MGMILNDEIHTVELVQNGMQEVRIFLKKFLKINELFGIGNNSKIKNISFGLFTGEKMMAVDDIIEIITLYENEKAVFKTDLPMDSYYVQKFSIDNVYVLSDEKYLVLFKYVDQKIATVGIVVNNDDAIDNQL